MSKPLCTLPTAECGLYKCLDTLTSAHRSPFDLNVDARLIFFTSYNK